MGFLLISGPACLNASLSPPVHVLGIHPAAALHGCVYSCCAAAVMTNPLYGLEFLRPKAGEETRFPLAV
jgi:hypothetical protein